MQAVAPCTQAPCSTACSSRRATPTTRSSSFSASSLPASSPLRGTSASSACASASGGSSTCHRCERGRGVGRDSVKKWTGAPVLDSWQLTRVGGVLALSAKPKPKPHANPSLRPARPSFYPRCSGLGARGCRSAACRRMRACCTRSS
eukprot:scaffold104729_cov58-Phaeocystis_antarctica.AAC.1